MLRSDRSAKNENAFFLYFFCHFYSSPVQRVLLSAAFWTHLGRMYGRGIPFFRLEARSSLKELYTINSTIRRESTREENAEFSSP